MISNDSVHASARAWERAALIVSFAVALTAVAGFGAVYSVVWVPADIALLLALTLTWAGLTRQRQPLPQPLILVPMLGFWLLAVVQYRHGSIYPGLTLPGIIQLSGCGAMFGLGLIAFRRSRHVLWLGAAAWWLCAGLAIESILQFFTSPDRIYWFKDASYATPAGPFIYHNHFAGCLALLLPLAWIHSFRPEKQPDLAWLHRLRRSVVPVLGMLAVVLARSRGGVLTLAFEAVVALLLFWRPRRTTRRQYQVAVIAILLLAGLGALIPWAPFAARFQHLAHHDLSALDRVRVAESCLRIFQDHPWAGTGFGTFPAIYPAYRSFDDGKTFLTAHNEYAQLMAETGVLGAAALLGFLCCYGERFLRLRRESGDLRLRQVQLGAFIGTLGLAFQSAGDFEFHSPALALLFFLLASAYLSVPRAHRRPEVAPHRHHRQHASPVSMRTPAVRRD